jgi:hypothetical protein
MNCRAFEKCLDAYQTGTLGNVEYYQANQHVRDCPACYALLGLLESVRSCPALDIDLWEGVSKRTSGASCQRATELLCDYTDGTLDPSRSLLVRAHLEHCPRCRRLAEVLTELSGLLPSLSEITPTPSLVPQVLGWTRAVRQGSSGLVEKARVFVSGLLQRPHFSWEAAYLATLLIFALFGTPFSPLPDAGHSMRAALEQEKGLVSLASDNIAGVFQALEVGCSSMRKVQDRLATISDQSSRSLDTWRRAGQDRLAKAGRRLQAIRATSERVVADVSGKVKRGDRR